MRVTDFTAEECNVLISVIVYKMIHDFKNRRIVVNQYVFEVFGLSVNHENRTVKFFFDSL